jgi:hypothetical protein
MEEASGSSVQSRKRKKEDNVLSKPSDLSMDGFRQMMTMFALAGMDDSYIFKMDIKAPDQSNVDYASFACASDVVATTYDKTLQIAMKYLEMVIMCKDVFPGIVEFGSLHILLNQINITHHIDLDPEISPDIQLCSVTEKPVPPSKKLVLMTLHQHEKPPPQQDGVQKFKVYENVKASYMVSFDYAKIMFAFWYLLHVDMLVGRHAHEWFVSRKAKNDRKKKTSPDAPVFGTWDYVNNYLMKNAIFCQNVYRDITLYRTILFNGCKQLQKRLNNQKNKSTQSK